MKIYKVKTLDNYTKLISLMLQIGAKNMMDENIPLFADKSDLFRFLEISDRSIGLIYDENSIEKWDTQKNILPEDWLRVVGNIRINSLKLKYPFFVIVDGHSGWNRVGYNESKTFYECQVIEEL